MSKPYRLAITFTQETNGTADNVTLSEEFSDDENVHLMKTKVFTAVMTEALDKITQTLCDAALDAGSTSKPKK